MSRDELSAGRSTVEVYTSPHPSPSLDPEPALLALIESAKTSIYVGAYSFTLASVAQALIGKHQAGLQVLIAADKGENTPTSQYPVLLAASLDIRFWGTRYDLQHMKVIVADGAWCAWGSYNFSTSAEKTNFEVLTITRNPKLAGVLTSLIGQAYAAGVPAGG